MSIRIVTRAEWGARHGPGHPMPAGAKSGLVLHHDGYDRLTVASGEAEEAAVVRAFEDWHARHLAKNPPRIAYQWLVAPSGRIYEGLGWGRIGAHVADRNSTLYGVCVMMDGVRTMPTHLAAEAIGWIRRDGVSGGWLTDRHTLSGHRDHLPTECPGDLLYSALVVRPRANGETGASPPPVLRRGDRGPAVHALQLQLIELEQMTSRDVATGPGIFGPLTHVAVIAFQTAAGIEADGIVGPETYAALSAAVGS